MAEDYEHEPDDLTRAALADLNPMWSAICGVLDDWLLRQHGVTSGHHGVGLFLDLLAADGYRVEAIDPGPPIEQLLPVEPGEPSNA